MHYFFFMIIKYICRKILSVFFKKKTKLMLLIITSLVLTGVLYHGISPLKFYCSKNCLNHKYIWNISLSWVIYPNLKTFCRSWVSWLFLTDPNGFLNFNPIIYLILSEEKNVVFFFPCTHQSDHILRASLIAQVKAK